jgi:hypothetical protein
MKLPILPARVHRRGQLCQQIRIKSPPSKLATKLPRIHASQITTQAARNHRLRQPPCLHSSQRKHRRHPAARQLRFPISPHILQEQIAKNHMSHFLARSALHRLTHRPLINLIRTRRRNANLHQRQPCRLSLHFQQTFPHRMHRHAPMRPIHSSQQRHHIKFPSEPHCVQCPRTILPAAPSQPSLRPRHPAIAHQPFVHDRILPAPRGEHASNHPCP